MYKRFVLTGAALALLASTHLIAQTPQAAPATPPAAAVPMPAGPTKVAIIDMQVAISKCHEGQAAAKEITDRFGPKRSTLQKQQDEITELQKQLQTQDKTLSDDARNKLLQQIDVKQRTLQRDNDDASTEMQTAEQDAINEIGRKMMPLIQDYAKKNSLNVILDVSNPQTPVLYAEPGMDITQQIVAMYDEANPNAKPSASVAPGGSAPAAAAPKAAPAPAAAPKTASGGSTAPAK